MKRGNAYANRVLWENGSRWERGAQQPSVCCRAGVRLNPSRGLLGQGSDGGCVLGMTQRDSHLLVSCSLLLSFLPEPESNESLLVRAPAVYTALGGTEL